MLSKCIDHLPGRTVQGHDTLVTTLIVDSCGPATPLRCGVVVVVVV